MIADMGCSFQPPHATQFERPALSHMTELDFFHYEGSDLIVADY